MTQLLFLTAWMAVFQPASPRYQPAGTGIQKLRPASGSAAVQDSVIHVDSTYGFRLTVPDWWQIRETPRSMFGGTFPAVDEIENALVFKCFSKEEFKSIADFENWVIKDYSMGQSPKWSNQHRILLKKELDDFKETGRSYKVQLMRGNKLYDCCYILTATSTAYIWIDFTATSTTYPKNFGKLKEIISGFQKM